MPSNCTHLDQIAVRRTDQYSCEDCLRIGDTWVHLRLCLVCGRVACCDTSKNKHATRHFRASGHPIARSIEPGETWIWCYADRVVAGEIEA